MVDKKNINYEFTPAFERMRAFLASYVHCRNVSEAFSEEMKRGKISNGDVEARRQIAEECDRRCDAVHEFLESVETKDEEKQLLRLHYYTGMSIEAISEELYVSRSTAMRISKRAEEKALLAFIKYEEGRKSIA